MVVTPSVSLSLRCYNLDQDKSNHLLASTRSPSSSSRRLRRARIFGPTVMVVPTKAERAQNTAAYVNLSSDAETSAARSDHDVVWAGQMRLTTANNRPKALQDSRTRPQHPQTHPKLPCRTDGRTTSRYQRDPSPTREPIGDDPNDHDRIR